MFKLKKGAELHMELQRGKNLRTVEVRQKSNVDSMNSGRRGNRAPIKAHLLSTPALVQAMKLLETDSAALTSVGEEGLLKGIIVLDRRECPVSVKIEKSGGFVADPSLDYKLSLALVLKFVRLLNVSKKKSPLLATAPDWMDSNFRLSLPLEDEHYKFEEKIEINDIEQLQSYWALVDMASSKKSVLPAEKLAQHVFKIYGKERWSIQRAALEAILDRIHAAKQEMLRLAKKPPENEIFGSYQVGDARRNIRPYEVVLASANGLDGSCTCKDYQKNTLGFCKHIAAVFLYWMRSPSSSQQFENMKPSYHGRIGWKPPVSLVRVERPLDGITFILQGDLKKRLETKWKELLDFFEKPVVSGVPMRLKNLTEAQVNAGLLGPKLRALRAAVTRIDSQILVDSVVIHVIDHELESLSWTEEFKKRSSSLTAIVSDLKVNLYPYQKEGVRQALAKGKFILADEMGLGKTVQAIAWAESLLRSGSARKTLVICPNALKYQWRREWLNSSGRQIKIVEGSPSDRKTIYESGDAVMVLNYELLLRDTDTIQNISPDVVILDEAQRIKNYITKTSQSVKKLSPKFRLILTGTPMENRMHELYSLMDWINSRALGPLWRLDSELSLEGDGLGHGTRGVRGLSLLRQKLQPHLLRRRRSEVLKQLPKRNDSPIYLAVTEEQQEIHDDYARKVARLMATAGVRPLTPPEHLMLMSYLTTMRIVSNGLAQHDYNQVWPSLQTDQFPEKRIASLASPKLAEFRNLIEGLLSQDGIKVVVFSQWQRMLRLANWAISDLLRLRGEEAVFFTGRETSRRRTENIVRFHDDPYVRIFFSTDAGGVGLNLQQAASVCINLELPWNPAVLEQRNSRIYRIGQKRPVQIYNLITQGTIEDRIQNLVAQKKAVFSGLFDGTSDEVRFEEGSSFYKQVQNIVQELNPAGASEVGEEPEQDEFRAAELVADLDDRIEDDQPTGLTSSETSHPVENNLSGDKQVEKKISADNIQLAFSQLKVEKSNSGGLKIEAEGESAKLLANMFRGMAELFETAMK